MRPLGLVVTEDVCKGLFSFLVTKRSVQQRGGRFLCSPNSKAMSITETQPNRVESSLPQPAVQRISLRIFWTPFGVIATPNSLVYGQKGENASGGAASLPLLTLPSCSAASPRALGGGTAEL